MGVASGIAERVKRFKVKSLHWFALSALGLAQPVLDILGKTPEFFVLRRSSGAEIVMLAVGLELLLPLGLLFFLWAFKKVDSRALPWLELGAFGISLLVLFLPFANRLAHHSSWGALALALISALAVAALAVRTSVVQAFFDFLAVAIVAVPAVFFARPEIFRLLAPSPAASIVGLSVPTGSPAPVVLVIFDEFPLGVLENGSGQLNRQRFPNFAKLADRATWYRNATAVSSWTEHAVPAILSGKYPRTERVAVPDHRDHPQNIFTLLQATHEISAYEQLTHLCPDEVCGSTEVSDSLGVRGKSLLQDVAVLWGHAVLPKMLKKKLPQISGEWGNFIKDNAPQKGLGGRAAWEDDDYLFRLMVQNIRVTAKPGLYFVHVTFPHVPYRHYPSGKTYVSGLERTNEQGFVGRWSPRPWASVLAYQRLILQTMYADRLVGELLERLEHVGLFDASVLAVTADHGSAFIPGDFSRQLSKKNQAEVLRVPLLVKLPKQEQGKVSDENAQTIDLLPTILSAAGFSVPLGLDGRVLGTSGAPKRKTFFQFIKRQQRRLELDADISGLSATERQARIFGESAEDVYRIGPGRSLLGSPAVARPGLTPIEAELDRARRFENVDLNSDSLPGLVSGSFRKSCEGFKNVPLVVSLNGVFAASTWSDSCQGGRARFSVLLQEDLLRAGENQIQVYELSDELIHLKSGRADEKVTNSQRPKA